VVAVRKNEKAPTHRGLKAMASHLNAPSPGQSLLGDGSRRRKNGIVIESTAANRPAGPAMPAASLYTRVPAPDPIP